MSIYISWIFQYFKLCLAVAITSCICGTISKSRVPLHQVGLPAWPIRSVPGWIFSRVSCMDRQYSWLWEHLPSIAGQGPSYVIFFGSVALRARFSQAIFHSRGALELSYHYSLTSCWYHYVAGHHLPPGKITAIILPGTTQCRALIPQMHHKLAGHLNLGWTHL
jgi:hypothetical protein